MVSFSNKRPPQPPKIAVAVIHLSPHEQPRQWFFVRFRHAHTQQMLGAVPVYSCCSRHADQSAYQIADPKLPPGVTVYAEVWGMNDDRPKREYRNQFLPPSQVYDLFSSPESARDRFLMSPAEIAEEGEVSL